MTNDEYIKAISECHGDPGKIAIVQANHIQGLVGNSQLNAINIRHIQRALTDLIRRFAEHEAGSDDVAHIDGKGRAAICEQLVRLVELLAPPSEEAPDTPPT